MTAASQPTAEVMPALGLLAHSVRVVSPEVSVLIDTPPGDVVLVDARHTLAEARGLCRLLQTTGVPVPVLAVLTEGGLAAVAADWGVDDVLLDTAGPAEVEARLRLAVTRRAAASAPGEGGVIRAGDLAIDETHVHLPAARPAARPDVQGVRAAEVPGPAPGPGLLPGPAAAGGLGLRLLRRHPHGRRARPAAAGQARHRARAADRHRAQRRLQVRPAASDAGRRGAPATVGYAAGVVASGS